MNFKPLFALFLIAFIFSCKQEKQHLTRIEGKQIAVTDSLETDPEIEAFIKPYRDHVNKNMDSVISYAMHTYSKTDGELNTAIGNLFADVMFEQGNPIFKKRTGKDIDMVLANHGGIRAIISEGNITTRTAYEIMPFENSIVVAPIKGSQVNQMIAYLLNAKRAHPISKLHIVADKNYQLVEATINNKPIDTSKIYYVATNDYLYNGGDGMTFFQPSDSLYILNYKIRNAFIDYFKNHDTINPVIDNRFIKLDH
ncbi:5'-nucleotidase C-terminal domain-containing protein [Xanthomarina sp. F2636L]|uniref:5'-nucleotidase C-terminal domain-containing protein n=1 Tax=Xanthomarina sp. F2636L TaxID=2996018 RepID=UPI00225E0EC1|nr:5'-nucleotidase C-terminal domain-containing protein [Xanthomarina sp. F2636L]MCX7552196.1 5'-nucleotidase C-terminal domain-containing protein [Xanthomarina sp. F2636L]